MGQKPKFDEGPFTDSPKECWEFYEDDSFFRAELQSYAERLSDKKKIKRAQVMARGRQYLALREWRSAKDKIQDLEPGKATLLEVGTILGQSLNKMKREYFINKTLSVLFWVVTEIEPLPESDPVHDEFLMGFIFFNAVLDLYAESTAHQRHMNIAAYPHGPRTLFEQKHGLVDAATRWEFVQLWMEAFKMRSRT